MGLNKNWLVTRNVFSTENLLSTEKLACTVFENCVQVSVNPYTQQEIMVYNDQFAKFKEQSWLTLDLVKDLQLFNHCAQV